MRLLLCVLVAAIMFSAGCGPRYEVAEALRDGKYDDAIFISRSLLEKDPMQRKIRLSLGRAYLYKGEYDRAQKEFRRVYFGSGEDWEAALYVGVSQLLEGREMRGRETLRNIVIPFAPKTRDRLVGSILALHAEGLPRAAFLDALHGQVSEARQNLRLQGADSG